METNYIIAMGIGIIIIYLFLAGLLIIFIIKIIKDSIRFKKARVKVIYVSPYVIDKGCKMECFGNKLFKIQMPTWYGYRTVETYNEGEHYQLMAACVKYNIIF